MSKFLLKVFGEEKKMISCDARRDWNTYINGDRVGSCCSSWLKTKEVEGKTIIYSKLKEFDYGGITMYICEECFNLWMEEPERISFPGEEIPKIDLLRL